MNVTFIPKPMHGFYMDLSELLDRAHPHTVSETPRETVTRLDSQFDTLAHLVGRVLEEMPEARREAVLAPFLAGIGLQLAEPA